MHTSSPETREDGGQYIAHILMFVRNALEVLRLRGNYLGNVGVADVLAGARRTNTLAEIDLYDNKFSDSPEVADSGKSLNTCAGQTAPLVSPRCNLRPTPALAISSGGELRSTPVVSSGGWLRRVTLRQPRVLFVRALGRTHVALPQS